MVLEPLSEAVDPAARLLDVLGHVVVVGLPVEVKALELPPVEKPASAPPFVHHLDAALRAGRLFELDLDHTFWVMAENLLVSPTPGPAAVPYRQSRHFAQLEQLAHEFLLEFLKEGLVVLLGHLLRVEHVLQDHNVQPLAQLLFVPRKHFLLIRWSVHLCT